LTSRIDGLKRGQNYFSFDNPWNLLLQRLKDYLLLLFFCFFQGEAQDAKGTFFKL